MDRKGTKFGLFGRGVTRTYAALSSSNGTSRTASAPLWPILPILLTRLSLPCVGRETRSTYGATGRRSSVTGNAFPVDPLPPKTARRPSREDWVGRSRRQHLKFNLN